MKKRLMCLLAVLLIMMQLVSCGKAVTSEGKSYDYATNTDNSYVESPSFEKTETDYTSSVENDLNERKIIKNANVDFETKEYDNFIKSLNILITEHGGYVESQDTRGTGIYDTYSSRYSNFTIRIPADNYDSFISSVGDIGSLTYIKEYQNDVTMNYIDLESHIGALEAEYKALISILEKSTDINDIITVQSRISEINYQLDSLKSQLRKYDDLISYCTVNLSVSEVRRETPKTADMTFGERISSGLSETFANIGDGFTEFSIWFVVSLPYFIIWGIIIAVFVVILTIICKKSKKKISNKELTVNKNDEQKKD